MINYFMQGDGSRSAITVFMNGEAKTATTESHPNFDHIVQAAIDGNPGVFDLFDTQKARSLVYARVSDRVSVNDEGVFVDGDPAPPAIQKAFDRHYAEGVNPRHIVNFVEKLWSNVSSDVRERLFAWLEADGNFTITDDGMIVAYKGVRSTDDGYVSVHSGQAIVDGVVVEGQIPNNVGSVIEMPRSAVVYDPRQACSTGLHAGTYAYAKSFARGGLLEVHIDPRDVVSVPLDSGGQKMRVCRYKVVGVTEVPIEDAVRGYQYAPTDWFGWGEYDEDYCEDCDSDFCEYDVDEEEVR